MNETPIEIHPYDFAELLSDVPVACLVDTYKKRDDGLIEWGDKLYHRTVKAPRTPGPHFIE